LVRPNDGCVEEGGFVIDVYGEFLEEPFPDAALRPPGEPIEDGLPGAEPLRQIAPGNARPCSPDDRVDELAVAALRDGTGTRSQKRLDLLPLVVGQFMSAHEKR